MENSWAKTMGNASNIYVAAVGRQGNARKFVNSFDPEKVAESPEICDAAVISHVTYHGWQTVRRHSRGGKETGAWFSKVDVRLDYPCTLIENGTFDPSSALAAHLVKYSSERELEIEYYSSVPSKGISEHVVLLNGAVSFCESRPLDESEFSFRSTRCGYRLLFDARPQNKLEEATVKREAENPQKLPKWLRRESRRKLPDPWHMHPDDFLAVPRTDEVAALEEVFKRQAALLGEIVTPVDYDATFVRSTNVPRGSVLIGNGAYEQYMSQMYDYYDSLGKAAKSLFDIVGFWAAKENAAFVSNVADLVDVPFQGRGGFGLAVVPASLKRSDVDDVLGKIALCQFLGVAPQGLECIVVTRASKLDLKRLQELEDAGIPIVFDFTGRTNSAKEKRDPLDGMFSKVPLELSRFDGQLNEDQAALLNDALDEESVARMLKTLQEAVCESTNRYYGPQWSEEVIGTLTYGHEEVGQADAPRSRHGAHSRFYETEPNAPWQFSFATFPPESMPSLGSARAVKRMHDVGVIWSKTLREYGLKIRFEELPKDQRGRSQGASIPNKENFQEIGRHLGIDAMIDSLYDGVPLDYII